MPDTEVTSYLKTKPKNPTNQQQQQNMSPLIGNYRKTEKKITINRGGILWGSERADPDSTKYFTNG